MIYQGIKHKSINKVIVMKVASRERPDQLLKTIAAYIEMANNTKDMVWLFSFDDDDRTATYELNQKIFALIDAKEINTFIYHKESKNKIHAINRDLDRFELKWDILLNISDDQMPVIKGYDDQIRSQMPDDLDCSLWFNDGHQDRINTQEIIGKAYFDRTGKIYNSEYSSFFCDNEATEIAEKLGKLKKIPNCIIRHYHPQWDDSGAIKNDSLYVRNNGFWKQDQETYNKRKQLKFT